MVQSWNKRRTEAENAITALEAIKRGKNRRLEIYVDPDPMDVKLIKNVLNRLDRGAIFLVLLDEPEKSWIRRQSEMAAVSMLRCFAKIAGGPGAWADKIGACADTPKLRPTGGVWRVVRSTLSREAPALTP
jgi:hypothetical protein